MSRFCDSSAACRLCDLSQLTATISLPFPPLKNEESEIRAHVSGLLREAPDQCPMFSRHSVNVLTSVDTGNESKNPQTQQNSRRLQPTDVHIAFLGCTGWAAQGAIVFTIAK